MIWIYAKRFVAFMANKHPLRYFSKMVFPRIPMNCNNFVRNCNSSVSVTSLCPSPQPTSRIFVYLSKESQARSVVFFETLFTSFTSDVEKFFVAVNTFIGRISTHRKVSLSGVIPRVATTTAGFLLAFIIPIHADQISVSNFRGINSNESSVIIGPEYAADSLNCDVTPGGKSVKKRPGYGIYKQLYSTQLNNLHGGYHFFDSTGNDVQVWGSSTSVYGIVADATPTQLVSSATLNSTLDCVDIQGSAYCATSSRDFLLKTDGATKTWFTTALGTMVEATPDRLVVAGVASNLSTLYVSGANSYTTFTSGPLPTDPFTEVIAAPGSKLTHTRWGCGKLLWWKDQSFGYFAFEDQFTGEVKIVSDTIGTFDNTSAIDPGGNVWFRGQDGHIWRYDCSGLIKESIEITPNVQSSGRRTANSWTQDSQSDFQGGFSINVDSATSPGDLSLTGFSDTFSSLVNWGVYIGTWTLISNGVKSKIDTADSTTQNAVLVTTTAYSVSSNFHLSAQVKFESLTTALRACVGLVNVSTNGFMACASVQSSDLSVFGGSFDGSVIGDFTEGHRQVRDTNYHYFTLKRENAGVSHVYFDGVVVATFTSTVYTNLSRPFLSVSGGNLNTYVDFKEFYVKSSTGVYFSAWKNAPNFTTWDTFSPTYSNAGGLHEFYIRASTSPQSVLNTTVTWVSQAANTLVGISTPGIYFQIRDDFSIGAATNTPTLNSFTVNWNEGTATDQAYMLYFDNSIWASVAYGAGVSSNTYIFKRDLINDGWTLYNFGAGGMLVQNNHLFFGDVSANANVFQYDSGTADSGTVITAFWKSKDFTGSDPFLQNQYTQIDSLLRQNSNQTITTTYKLDTSTTSTSYTINLSSTTQSIINNRKTLPIGKNGYLINIQYGDSTTTSAFELLGYRVIFTQQPWRPSQ